jgi:hypothetical protein
MWFMKVQSVQTPKSTNKNYNNNNLVHFCIPVLHSGASFLLSHIFPRAELMMKSIVRVGFLLLLVGKFHAAPTPEDDGVCHEDDAVCQQQQRQQQPDRSLIQFKQALVAKHGRTNETYDEAEDAEEDKAEGAEEDEGEDGGEDECKGPDKDKSIGCRQPLTPAGFENVKLDCCGKEMMKFIRRLIERTGDDGEFLVVGGKKIKKKTGRKVCYDAGLAGLTWWYDCKAEDKPADWKSLKDAISKKSKAVGGTCPWIQQTSGECPSRGSDCPGDASDVLPCTNKNK